MKKQSVRRLKYGSNTVIGIILLIISLVAVNFIAERSRYRFDLTRNKEKTLSLATQNILKNMKNQVNVTVYATTESTPPAWTEQRKQLRDLLMDFRSISKGKVHFTFVDPSKDTVAERKAQENGIRRQLMAQESAKELNAREGYLGFTVEQAGNTETVGVISPQHPLEYQLTMAINKVGQIDIPKIGIVTPMPNQFSIQGRYNLVKQVFEQEGYTLQPYTPETFRTLLDENAPKMLVIFEPDELTEESQFYIDQYIMKGGKMIVASSSFAPSQNAQMNQAQGLQPFESPINPIIESYGLRINRNMVEDWGMGEKMMLRTTRGPVIISYPLTFRVTDINKETSATDRLNNLAFSYASSISQTDNAVTGTVTVLASSSKQSLLQEDLFRIDPGQLLKRPKIDESEMRSYDLLVMVQGHLKSKFASVADDKLPILTREDGTTYTVARDKVLAESTGSPMVIVSGSADIFADELIQQVPVNALLLLNLSDMAVRNGDMISLRSKMSEVPRLRIDVSPARIDMIRWSVVFAVPVCLVLFGICVAFYNRMRRRRFAEIYDPDKQDD